VRARPGDDAAGAVEDADAAGDRVGGAGVVAGDHHRRDAGPVACGDGGGRLRPRGVGHGDQPEQVQAGLGGRHRLGHRRQVPVGEGEDPVALRCPPRCHRPGVLGERGVGRAEQRDQRVHRALG